MSMLQPARQRSAYAKIGISGEAGSGKTYTATYSKVYLEVSNLSESADGNTLEVTGEVYGGVAYVQA